ncbi:hypothetical protein R4K89_09295 [Brachyspira intermedia]
MKKQLFKFLLCLTAVIFAVSCGGNNDSPTNPTQGEFTVNFESYPEPADKTIGTSSEKTSFTKEGKIRCYPGTDAKVEISKVTPVTASGSVSLEPADFEVLTPTVSATANEIRIVLSASGIEKVKKATAGQVSEYTFTFLFTRTSDNKTATSETKLNVVNIDIINQTDIETAMKNAQDGDTGKGNLVVGTGPKWVFSLSSFTLNKTSGFTATAQSTSGSMYVSSAESAITLQAKATGFFFSAKGKKDTEKQATLTITVKLNNSGYMLDDAINYVATDGFKLILSLGQTDGTWKQL